jgi:hypothetical protein
VPVFNEDTDAPVLGSQRWEEVHERRARGHTISAIARELDLDLADENYLGRSCCLN